MERIIFLLHKAATYTGGDFAGIGVACPGPLDSTTGEIGVVGTLVGWDGGNLISILKPEFGVRIAVENDADAATLAVATSGIGKGSSHLIYVTVSTGIGAGILLDGHLYRGFRGTHPELGHLIVDASSGSRCYCKASGCWESLASGEAIATWMQEQQPVTVRRTAAEICLLAEQGDAIAMKAMDREGYYLGLGLANLITIFAPKNIILGGGVMRSHRLFLPHALDTIRNVCTQVPAEETTISVAPHESEAGLAGAVQAWLSRYAWPLQETNSSATPAPGASVEVPGSSKQN
jgi:glucokinase